MIHDKQISNWLFFTAFMVFCMAVIGAVTRLTESGLSMVEWRPLIGTLPPLSEAEWMRVFELYRETPEYKAKNAGMTLDEFKNIFFWEWFHRLWGRLIGVVYALPLFYFWVKKQIPQRYGWKLLVGLLLGGSQAVMGWYMVESGLVDRPAVSHFRLAAHLSLAALIFGYLLWLAFDLRGVKGNLSSFCQKRHGWLTLAVIAITILWGAFVAGLDAGLVYNDWPKMGNYWIPPEVTGLRSLIFDHAAVQFTHRWLAILTMVIVITYGWRMKNYALIGMVCVQVILGIATLLSLVAIPLAAAHQAGAFILIALMIYQLKKIH